MIPWWIRATCWVLDRLHIPHAEPAEAWDRYQQIRAAWRDEERK